MTTNSAVNARPSKMRSGSGTPMIREFFGIVLKYRARSRNHRIVLKLDDHTLRDIGLTRLEVSYREANTSLCNHTAR